MDKMGIQFEGQNSFLVCNTEDCDKRTEAILGVLETIKEAKKLGWRFVGNINPDNICYCPTCNRKRKNKSKGD